MIKSIKKKIKSAAHDFLCGLRWGVELQYMKRLNNETWRGYLEVVASQDVMHAMKLDAHRPTGLFPQNINPYIQ